MVLAQLGDILLLCGIILGADDLIHPPLVAACSAQHAAHQMIASVCMCKGMQRIELVYAEVLGRDKDGSAGSQGNVAHIVAYGTGSHCCRSVVACACCYLTGCGDTQLCSDLRKNGSDCLIGLIAGGQLILGNTADVAHLLGPLAILHVKYQHTGRIGYVGAVYAGELVCDIILGQHDLCDLRKVLRLVVLHPQDLRSGKACKCNVRCVLGKFLLADHIVQIVSLLRGTSVVPENRGTNHIVILIQDHKTVHLTAEADACHLTLVHACDQFLDTIHGLCIPILRLLL